MLHIIGRGTGSGLHSSVPVVVTVGMEGSRGELLGIS